jgi:hypothetical protein
MQCFQNAWIPALTLLPDVWRGLHQAPAKQRCHRAATPPSLLGLLGAKNRGFAIPKTSYAPVLHLHASAP